MKQCSVFMTPYYLLVLSKSRKVCTKTSLSRIVNSEGNRKFKEMEKFFKSIFHSADRRKSSHEGEGEEEKTDNPPMDARRQLSISRSGRMRQANKKRHSLTLELYGDGMDTVKKPVSVQYYVHNAARPANQTAPAIMDRNENRLEGDSAMKAIQKDTELENTFEATLEKKLKGLDLDGGRVASPEEEIDSAFEIIDKS